MIPLGLSATRRRDFFSLLVNSHLMRVRIWVLDKNEDHLGELTDSSRVFILDGAVQIDTTSDISRQLTLSILDPDGRIQFDANTPSNEHFFMDRFLRVQYGVYSPTFDDWYDVPIFQGPITKIEQDGQIANVEAMGKESLLLSPALMWTSRHWKRGHKITDVITDILNAKGENRMTIPNLPHRLHKPLSIVGTDQGWPIINGLCKGIGYQCFYDGSGRFRMRKRPKNAVWNFQFQTDVLSRPVVPYDFTTIRNIIQVRGPQPDDKSKKRIVYTSKLHSADPASANNLSRNGKPRALVEVIDADHVRKLQDAKDIANDRRDQTQILGSDISFESLVIPFLEEYDPVQMTSPDFKAKISLKQFTIPLLSTSTMSIGFNKKVKVVRVRRRRTRSKER